jgi:phosphatidate cytidylyltransferase
MLRQRVLAALVGGPVFLAAAYAGGWVLASLLVVLTVIGLLEYVALFRLVGVRVPAAVALPLGVGFIACGAFGGGPGVAGQIAVVALLACLALPVLGGADRAGYGVPDAAACFLGPIYVGYLLSFILYLRAMGVAVIGMLVAVIWVGDSMAYFVGKAWGRRPLSFRLSPNKTVEGAIAGLAGSAVAGCGVGSLIGLPPVIGFLVGLLTGAVGQVGDLGESAFKRYAGVKDSGSILPGHGGILDRFDSMMVAAPVLYYLLALLLGGKA